jgi:hypothetical protein
MKDYRLIKAWRSCLSIALIKFWQWLNELNITDGSAEKSQIWFLNDTNLARE